MPEWAPKNIWLLGEAPAIWPTLLDPSLEVGAVLDAEFCESKASLKGSLMLLAASEEVSWLPHETIMSMAIKISPSQWRWWARCLGVDFSDRVKIMVTLRLKATEFGAVLGVLHQHHALAIATRVNNLGPMVARWRHLGLARLNGIVLGSRCHDHGGWGRVLNGLVDQSAAKNRRHYPAQ